MMRDTLLIQYGLDHVNLNDYIKLATYMHIAI